MQLTKVALQAAMVLALSTVCAAPRAEVATFDGRTTVYDESLPYGKMTVINPSAALRAKPWEFLRINAGWQADIVSGASIKTRNGVRGSSPDVVSSASVKDLRNVVHGGVAVERKLVSLAVGYSYSTERDYRSHSIDVTAKAQLFDRATELSVSYARNWDEVCDREQTDPDPTRRHSLDTADLCFKSSQPLTSIGAVTSRPIAIDSIQGLWTQVITPTFATQATLSAQILNGFLSNPYREVNIGNTSPVQEYVPGVRARYAVGMRANWYLRAIKTAARLGARLYRDTWNLRALTTELELERYVLIEALRVRARGRVYTQTQAIFYSDDYLLDPRGQYFTGDRELSRMHSVLAGLRILYGPSAGEHRFLGLAEKLDLSLGADYVWFGYDDFTINGIPLTKRAVIASLGITILF
ncbi:MAG: hypothetical protein NVS3B20_23420 [Polyangiales bacterium]